MLLNKISNILGDVIFKKVTFLNGKEVPIFIFQGYVPKRAGCKSGIEDQVCKVLNKANVTAVHSEHSIWLEMCQILHAQAFLYKHQGKWSWHHYAVRNIRIFLAFVVFLIYIISFDFLIIC